MRVQPLGFLRDAIPHEVVPIPIEVGATHIQHRLGTLDSPAHARALHPVFDKVATRPLDDPRGNGIACRQIHIVTHAMGIVVEVGTNFDQLFSLLAPQLALRTHLPKPGNDRTHLAFEKAQDPVVHFAHPSTTESACQPWGCVFPLPAAASQRLSPWQTPRGRLGGEADSPRGVYALGQDAPTVVGRHPGFETATWPPLLASAQRDQSCTRCLPPPSSSGSFWPVVQDHGRGLELQGRGGASECPCHRHSPRTGPLPPRAQESGATCETSARARPSSGSSAPDCRRRDARPRYGSASRAPDDRCFRPLHFAPNLAAGTKSHCRATLTAYQKARRQSSALRGCHRPPAPARIDQRPTDTPEH